MCTQASFVKNIEVKATTSNNPSQLAKNIKEGFEQVGKDGTVAIYLPGKANNGSNREFVQKGYDEAVRKGHVIGKVEVWFSDKTKLEL